MTSSTTRHNTSKAIYPFEAPRVFKRFNQLPKLGGTDALQPGETTRFSLCLR